MSAPGAANRDADGRRRPVRSEGSEHDIDLWHGHCRGRSTAPATGTLPPGASCPGDRVRPTGRPSGPEPQVFAPGRAFGGSPSLAMSHGQGWAYYSRRARTLSTILFLSYPVADGGVCVAQDLKWGTLGLPIRRSTVLADIRLHSGNSRDLYTWRRRANEGARCLRCDAKNRLGRLLCRNLRTSS